MLAYALRRLLLVVPTLLGISVVAFALVQLAPGEADAYLFAGRDGGLGAVPAADAERMVESFRERYLLDRPVWIQYLHYLGPFDLGERGHRWFGGTGESPWHGLLALDLGTELLRSDVAVADELRERLAVTVPLAALAVLLSYLIAVPVGIVAAVRRGGWFDVASGALLFALYAVPAFWAGLMLQWVFGRTGLDWLPALGLHAPEAEELSRGEYVLDALAHLVLPVACYTYGGLAYLSRQMRAALIEVAAADYVRTARAKGLAEHVVVGKHALRNALLPLITLFAAVFPALVGGSIVVESVFDIPGMGRYAYEGLLRREVNVVMATTLCSAAMTLVGLWVADLLYAVADPRLRHG